MAVSKTMIKACAMEDVSTASILTNVNAELSVDNEQGMFVTIFLAILNIRTGEVTYTNAGHNPPFLRRKNGVVERIDERHGPIVAAMPGLVYREAMLQLNTGDALLLYTDGVSEEISVGGELYGEERMIEVLANSNVTDAVGIVNETVRAVTEFKGAKQQEDDITVLTLTYDATEQESMSSVLREVAVNELTEIARINEAFEVFLSEHEVAPKVAMTMGMIFDELLNNIISYGYKDGNEHQIIVRGELTADRLVVSLTDDGIPFNPLNKATPDATLSLEDRSVGGLGIHLVRNMVDEITYQRRVDRNLLTLVKKL
jgi:sigma-B regulation protein RsbU (phosphoserine phosphatase)